jgi:hypothetical protein
MLHRAEQLQEVSIYVSAIVCDWHSFISVRGYFCFPHGSGWTWPIQTSQTWCTPALWWRMGACKTVSWSPCGNLHLLLYMSIYLTWFQHADQVQQAFSSDEGPSLHAGLPALEALHKAWSSRATKGKYSDFRDALNDAAAKIAEYYDKTATSDAFIFAMCELRVSISWFNTDQIVKYFIPKWRWNTLRNNGPQIFKATSEKLPRKL